MRTGRVENWNEPFEGGVVKLAEIQMVMDVKDQLPVYSESKNMGVFIEV